MTDIAILSAVRTPVGAFQGTLSSLPAHALGTRVLRAAFERAGVDAEAIEQVYMGCVLTAGQGQAPARQAALGAGCSASTGAVTLNKVCGSAMRAVMTATNDLKCGDFSLVAAGGMESMSRAPYLAERAREGLRLGHGRLTDSLILDGLWDPYGDLHMGNCAELCAREYQFSREQQDDFTVESYRRALAAVESGAVADEIVPVEVPQRKGDPELIEQDEEPPRGNFDKMRRLRPAFQAEGTVTAANSSKINDGAAALVLATPERAADLGLEPMARIRAHASFAQEPERFTTAPAGAVRRLLERADLKPEDIDLWEVNEAFAVVAMAFMRDLGLEQGRVNVRGGAVALGHPIGASGARILVTLLYAMREQDVQLGCAVICIGGGEATALLVERERAG